MKRLKTLFLLMLTCLMLVQLVPFSAAAETTSDLSAVLSPISQGWVSARKPDVALSAGSSTFRINGDAHDESLILASFSGDQLVGKNRLELVVPVSNDAAETVTVSVIDNYTVDPATVTYNSVKSKLDTAETLCEYTLVEGDNTIDVSALLDMKLTNRFTLVLRSKAIGESDNVHSYFYDFEDYELSTDATFFKNPGSNSRKIGYLDGTTTNSLLWRGANADSNQNSIVVDPLDTTGENKVLSNYIGGSYNSSGRLRPFDALSHDKLTTSDIGKTYRFGFRIMVDNEADNATAKLSIGYAEASSTTFTMKLNNQEISQADGWQSYSIDYIVVADDVPAEDAVTRTNGDRMFVFRIDGGTAEAPVNWYIDDMYTVQLDADGNELCAVIDGGVSMNAAFLPAASPTATGYVSSALSTTMLGGHEQAVISGYSEDLCISYLTFRTEDLGDGKYAILELPGCVEGSQEVDVFLIDGYAVNETDLNWDKRYTLENCPLIGTATLSEENQSLLFTNLASRITGEYFTLALCAKNSYSDYVLRLDFEDYADNATVTVTTDANASVPYSDTYIFRSGGATTNFSATSQGDNMIATYTTNAAYNRFKLYNSFSPED